MRRVRQADQQTPDAGRYKPTHTSTQARPSIPPVARFPTPRASVPLPRRDLRPLPAHAYAKWSLFHWPIDTRAHKARHLSWYESVLHLRRGGCRDSCRTQLPARKFIVSTTFVASSIWRAAAVDEAAIRPRWAESDLLRLQQDDVLHAAFGRSAPVLGLACPCG